mmetsp:Transcript_16355/g.18647  ORF Transcript_16355/g.18647 Transcript_16355/m.18647 type:complete len:1277 (+) Transcript_16355:127-3957(+)
MSENSSNDGSILFQPHRTVGLISTAQPYTCSHHKASKSHIDTFITVPLQERFVIYKCDSLKPVLVSEHLHGTRKSKTLDNFDSTKSSVASNDEMIHSSSSSGGEKMFGALSDSSLGITVTTHGYKGRWSANYVTLYKRNKIIDTRMILHNKNMKSWGIVNVLNLGKSKFPISKESSSNDFKQPQDDYEKDEGGKFENCLVLAMVCAKHSLDDHSADGHEVEIVGDDTDEEEENEETDDDSSSDSSSSGSDSSRNDESMTKKESCRGEIVIVIASRNKLFIKKRVPLHDLPNFTPSFSMHPHTYINKILIGSTKGDMILLNIRSGKVIHQFSCFSKSKKQKHGKITVLEQSPAVDTVAVGTQYGQVHLVNIRMDVQLFTLYHDSKSSGNNKNLGITSLSFRTDAAALEHGIAPLAVGQMNGSISIWDLTPRSDDDSDLDDDQKSRSANDYRRTLLCQMQNAHPGGVCNLNYFAQEPLLLSSGIKSNSLVMHIFDNPNHTGRILRQRAGHISPPSLIRYQYSSNGGVLASMTDGTDAASCQILSCGGKGDSSLRLFSTARSILDREFSQGKGLVKKARDLGLEKADLYLNEIIGLATCESKSRDWGDMVTIHKNHAMAYVWSTKRKAQSGPVLRQEDWNVSAMKVQPPKSAHASSICISSCGNFAIIGTKCGVIYKYNIQSGLPRGSFPRDATDVDSKVNRTKIVGDVNRTTKLLERSLKIHKLHEKEKDMDILKAEVKLKARLQTARHNNAEVTGLAIDALNKTLVSVGSDSKLILWSFSTHAPHRRSPIHLPSPGTKLVHARDSDLLAIALEDYSTILFDCSSLSIVRRFGAKASYSCHTGPITDLAFGPDGRKLFTSSIDGTLRVWDVPTNTCVDWMSFASAPTSLALSSTGEFLATTHQGRLGLSLWCDRSFFQTVHLGIKPPPKPYHMDEPAAVAEDHNDDDIAAKVMEENATTKRFASSRFNMNDKNLGLDDSALGRDSLTPKKDGLITLSGLPAAHWKNLFHLELVKERNKPNEAPKKPPSAPFFLQWRPSESMNPKSDGDVEGGEEKEKADKDEWAAAWSDDEVEKIDESNNGQDNMESTNTKRKLESATNMSVDVHQKVDDVGGPKKKSKVTLFRSDLATILEKCSHDSSFDAVTKHLASMGPSSIDVAFSTLCHGMHDLEDGLPLLRLASMWLLEACQTRQNYEVINAYLHRFLHIHAATIAGVDASLHRDKTSRPISDVDENFTKHQRLELIEIVKELRAAQLSSTEKLRNKLQQSLCLLRHFSRIV